MKTTQQLKDEIEELDNSINREELQALKFVGYQNIPESYKITYLEHLHKLDDLKLLQAQLQAQQDCLKMIDEEIDEFEIGTKYTGIFTEKKVKQIIRDRMKELKQSIHNKIEGERQ